MLQFLGIKEKNGACGGGDGGESSRLICKCRTINFFWNGWKILVLWKWIQDPGGASGDRVVTGIDLCKGGSWKIASGMPLEVAQEDVRSGTHTPLSAGSMLKIPRKISALQRGLSRERTFSGRKQDLRVDTCVYNGCRSRHIMIPCLQKLIVHAGNRERSHCKNAECSWWNWSLAESDTNVTISTKSWRWGLSVRKYDTGTNLPAISCRSEDQWELSTCSKTVRDIGVKRTGKHSGVPDNLMRRCTTPASGGFVDGVKQNQYVCPTGGISMAAAYRRIRQSQMKSFVSGMLLTWKNRILQYRATERKAPGGFVKDKGLMRL